MPDLAKKARRINAAIAKQMCVKQRNLFSIDKQIATLQRQEAYYKNLQDEVRNDFYNVKHDYTFEYREQINCQLLFFETMKIKVREAIEHLKEMKLKVSLGDF